MDLKMLPANLGHFVEASMCLTPFSRPYFQAPTRRQAIIWTFQIMACRLVDTKPYMSQIGSEPTRMTRMPAFWGYPRLLMITYFIESYWIPSQKKTKSKWQILKNSPKFYICEFWNKHYMRHTFWSCLIRCANMKWIRRVLLKIQSGHDSVHRRTDGQGETSIPPFQLRWSKGY